MADSKDTLCQNAAFNLGHTETVGSITTPVTAAGTIFAAIFEDLIQRLARGFDWEFLIKRVELTEAPSTVDIEGWSKAYLIPSDMLRARGLEPFTRTPSPNLLVPFRLEYDITNAARYLVTDQPDAELVYTEDITDPEDQSFPSDYINALEWALTAKAAMPLMGDTKLAREMLLAAGQARLEAIAADLNGRQEDVVPDPDLITAGL